MKKPDQRDFTKAVERVVDWIVHRPRVNKTDGGIARATIELTDAFITMARFYAESRRVSCPCCGKELTT